MIERLTTFQGLTVDDKIVEGDLLHLSGYPFRFIQNEKGGNTPVVFGSEKIKIGNKFIPINTLIDGNHKVLAGDFLVNSLKFIEEKASAGQKVYVKNAWKVTIVESEMENPIISLHINGHEIKFPGAFTEKDLTDLMFFFMGEEVYTSEIGKNL